MQDYFSWVKFSDKCVASIVSWLNVKLCFGFALIDMANMAPRTSSLSCFIQPCKPKPGICQLDINIDKTM